MDKKIIVIILFTGEKDIWCMLSGNFMARSGIKGYDVLITGDKKIPADDTAKTELKVFLN